jgi:hypothetical protein
MLNNQGSGSKHGSTITLDGTTGIKGSEYEVFIESRVRFEALGVGGTNTVICQGRIRGSTLYTTLATATGLVSAVADVSTYDYIRFSVGVASGSGTIISSGFISMF